MITHLAISLLLQVAPIPPRVVAENPALSSPLPKKVQNDYNKLWIRFRNGKEDAKVVKDLDKLLKKNPDQVSLIVLEAYLDLYNDRLPEGEKKLETVLNSAPANKIALSYLAEFAFARGDYDRASDL